MDQRQSATCFGACGRRQALFSRLRTACGGPWAGGGWFSVGSGGRHVATCGPLDFRTRSAGLRHDATACCCGLELAALGSPRNLDCFSSQLDCSCAGGGNCAEGARRGSMQGRRRLACSFTAHLALLGSTRGLQPRCVAALSLLALGWMPAGACAAPVAAWGECSRVGQPPVLGGRHWRIFGGLAFGRALVEHTGFLGRLGGPKASGADGPT
jgi:hypothetical protein